MFRVAERVTVRLNAIGTFRGYPRFLRTDGGPEFQSAEFAAWCAKHGVTHITIEPGKLQQNASIEASNG
jgi:transposase InsO family protein